MSPDKESGAIDRYTTECDECGTRLAKNDDGLFEKDGEPHWLCDGCIADRVEAGRP